MTEQKSGIDLSATSTTPTYGQGKFIVDDDGNEYVYGEAVGGAKTVSLLYVLDGTTGEVNDALTTAVAASGKTFSLCTPMAASVAQNSFGWFQVKGLMTLTTAAAVAANTKTYTTATGGKVDDDASGTVLIPGLAPYALIGGAQTGSYVCGHRMYVTN